MAHYIAEALGPTWAAERGYMVQRHAIIRGPDHQILILTHGDDSHRRSDHDRLRISASYGEVATHLHRGEGRDLITVRADRNPTSIAADINRRLLPNYHKSLQLCHERATTHERRLTEHQHRLHHLQGTLAPAKIIRDSIYFGSVGDPVHGRARVLLSGNTEFEVDVSADEARALAHHLAGRRYAARKPAP